jgi:hypothetical protein
LESNPLGFNTIGRKKQPVNQPAKEMAREATRRNAQQAGGDSGDFAWEMRIFV